jgi:F-type H+-transporting ATPase subunit delta
MQGASRETLAAGRERLEAIVASSDVAGLTTLADDLRAVAALFGREPTLRRTLSDPARSEEARTGLVDGLLSGKVSDSALDVLRVLVGGRWSAAGNLVDAVELLTVETLLAAAEKDGTLADVEDEIFRFSRVVAAHPQLDAVLSDATTDADRRTTVVAELLGGKASPVTVKLVELATVTGLGGRRFDTSLERLVELAAIRRDREVAYVRVAAPLSDQQESRLTEKLGQIYGRAISLKVQVDPSVIGGATVRVGDDLYDGSVARRLETARATLTR